MELKDLRDKIDEVDDVITGAYIKRLALVKQVGEYNITCNCIAPGTILTAMTETLGSADASLNVPLHRLGSVKDVAGAALFLASDESDFITGATISVNGGMSMI